MSFSEQSTQQTNLRISTLEENQEEYQALRHVLRDERSKRHQAERLIEELKAQIDKLRKKQHKLENETAAKIETLELTIQELRTKLGRSEHLLGLLSAHRAIDSLVTTKVEDLQAENTKQKKMRILAAKVFAERIRALEQSNRVLTNRLEKAKKYIAWLTRQYFGSKSEKMQSAKSEQSQDNVVPIKTKEKRKRGQQPGKGNGHGRSDRSQLPPVEEFIKLTDTCCSKCRKPYRVLSETEDSEVVEINVSAYRRIYRRRKAVSQCLCNGKQIIVAPVAPKLYPKTQIGNTLWVYLIIWTYMQSVPLNRILKDLAIRKLHLSHGTAIGGFKYISELFEALYRAIAARCQADDLWNNDETGWCVLEEDDGTRNKKKWWFWLFAGADAIVYKLHKSRSKDVPREFFQGSYGTMMSDRYAVYHALSDSIENAWCLVHAKRDFYNIFVSMPNLREWAEEWLELMREVFLLNNQRVALWKAGQEWQEAQNALEQHMQKLKERWQVQILQEDLHEQQKKVLNSLKKHWQGLVVFLKDPRIQPSNNRAERLLRPLVIRRKSSYGSGKEWSGMFAAKVFTILETWQANGLNPETLLLDFFNQCVRLPKIKGKPPPVPELQLFLPWTMTQERKEQFQLPKSIKPPT